MPDTHQAFLIPSDPHLDPWSLTGSLPGHEMSAIHWLGSWYLIGNSLKLICWGVSWLDNAGRLSPAAACSSLARSAELRCLMLFSVEKSHIKPLWLLHQVCAIAESHLCTLNLYNLRRVMRLMWLSLLQNATHRLYNTSLPSFLIWSCHDISSVLGWGEWVLWKYLIWVIHVHPVFVPCAAYLLLMLQHVGIIDLWGMISRVTFSLGLLCRCFSWDCHTDVSGDIKFILFSSQSSFELCWCSCLHTHPIGFILFHA